MVFGIGCGLMIAVEAYQVNSRADVYGYFPFG